VAGCHETSGPKFIFISKVGLEMFIKNIITILIITLIFTSSAFAFTPINQITVRLLEIPITINNVVSFENQVFEPFPFLCSEDYGVTYLPLSYYMANLMNLNISWTADDGLVIMTCDHEEQKEFSYGVPLSDPNHVTQTATIIDSKITINGTIIDNRDEPYPFLLFRDVVYVPLTERLVSEVLGWSSFMNRSGLNISVDNSFCITGVRVILNQQALRFDQPPIIENGRVLVPLRVIFEALDANVKWEQFTQTVTAVREDVTVELTIGSNILKKNGEQITLDVSVQLLNSRTLVPVRAVVDAFGANVEWIPERMIVEISI
jgi:hypothetical protein